MAAVPKQPNAANVLMSARTPAPPDGSKPAMVSVTGGTAGKLVGMLCKVRRPADQSCGFLERRAVGKQPNARNSSSAGSKYERNVFAGNPAERDKRKGRKPFRRRLQSIRPQRSAVRSL